LFTTGYSIENDIFVDGKLEELLSKDEAGAFAGELAAFIDWYALAFSRFLKDPTQAIDLHPNQLLDNAPMREELMALADGETYPSEMRAQLIQDYATLLRGKSLIAVLMRHLSYKGRPVRHHDKSIMEMVSVSPGPLLEKFYVQIEEIFSV
jgi:hypothetical protein